MSLSKIALAGLFAVAASQATALSCAFGPAGVAFAQAQADGPDSVAVRGVFDFEPHEMTAEGEEYRIRGRFTGHEILPEGGSKALETDVLVVGYCINGDCGYLNPGSEQITFLHREGARFVARSTPCASYPLAASDENAEIIRSCMSGGVCDTEMDW